MRKFIEVTTYVGSSRGVVTWPATGEAAQAYAADEVYPPQTYAEAPASVDDLPGRGNMRVSLSLSLVDPRESAWLTLNGIRYAMEHQWAGWFTLDLPEAAPNPFHVGRNEVVLELVVGGSLHAFPLVLDAVEGNGVIGHDPNYSLIGSISPTDLVVNIPPTGSVTIGSVRSLNAGFNVTNWTGAALWWGQYKEATLPPFWTKFVRTFEDTSVAGGEVAPVPDPSSKTFDFTVRTRQGVFPFMGSTQLYRGYVMHNIGSVTPERVTLGGVPGALTAVVYATESGVLRIVIQGVFGATGARLELGGEVYEVTTDRYNAIGTVVDVALPESPLVLGARQAGRLRLEGDLQATPVPHDPELYVYEFALEVGAAEDVPITGYITGMMGSISPVQISLLGEDMPVLLAGVAPAAIIYPGSSGAVFVVQLHTNETVTMDAGVVDIVGRSIPVSPVALPDAPLMLASTPDDDLFTLLDIGSEYPMTLSLTNPSIPPFEPKGVGVVFDVGAEDFGDGRVGFGSMQGSISPMTLTYEGNNFNALSCYTEDRGVAGVLLYIEFQGASSGFLYDGAGFEYAGRIYPAQVSILGGNSLVFEVTSPHIEPFTAGQSVQLTLYPGIEG